MFHQDIFLAGVNTSAVTLIWGLTELIRNPRVMKKVQEEIRTTLGDKKQRITEQDVNQLPYFKLMVKEIFRLHPAAPLLLPRETLSDIKIQGYDIPAKTQIMINVYSIARDPKLWNNPDEFNPDRFLDSSIDYRGLNFELLPFGSGRRLCPGMTMGIATIRRRSETATMFIHRVNATRIRPLVSFRLFSSAASLLQYCTEKPPIKPWPQRLFPKRLASMITQQQNIDLALQIFLYAGKSHPGFTHNYDTYHSILFKLSRARAFDPVESLMAELRKSYPPIRCGENLFIDLLRNYGLAGRYETSVRIFLRIPDYGVKRSVRSLNTLLNVLIQNKRFDLVHAMFKNSKESFGITPNIFTCNLLVKALCKKNDIESAYKVLDEIPSMGLVPNLVTYTTILGGYVARGDMEAAKKVLEEMLDRGWDPDATTYTVLMDGYCKLGRFSEAAKLMDEMEKNEIEPNEVTYGVMIRALCKEKKSGEARNMFDEMLDRTFMPDSSLCCRVIDALCEDHKVDEACSLWRKMLRNNCMPDNALLSTLIHWLCRDGRVSEARKLFDEFEKGSIPSLLTYNTLISGMCEKGELTEAGRLWDDMFERKCKPNAFTYNVLIECLSKNGNVKEGVRFLEEMLESGCFPNRTTFLILFDGLEELGKEEDAIKIVTMAVMSGKVDRESWELFLKKFAGELDKGVVVLKELLLENSVS
ncbi:unnamed protein product [Thlaspi arvense]|uniref:Cytochrome P450 n=1 Tax=Thlaspi arvense TaxID=13288 RepID=A0AAU9SWC7_THLAR|nr:unnamed protein product [Thlaspi arvense]